MSNWWVRQIVGGEMAIVAVGCLAAVTGIWGLFAACAYLSLILPVWVVAAAHIKRAVGTLNEMEGDE